MKKNKLNGHASLRLEIDENAHLNQISALTLFTDLQIIFLLVNAQSFTFYLQ